MRRALNKGEDKSHHNMSLNERYVRTRSEAEKVEADRFQDVSPGTMERQRQSVPKWQLNVFSSKPIMDKARSSKKNKVLHYDK